MATLLIRNVPPDLVDELKADAAKNSRSMQAEALEILRAAIEMRRRHEDFWKRADEIRRMRPPSDHESWEQIAEDRERGYRDEDL